MPEDEEDLVDDETDGPEDLDEEDLEDLDDEDDDVVADDLDDDAVLDVDEVLVPVVTDEPEIAVAKVPRDDDDDDDEDEEDSDDVEASLDVILKERMVVPDDEEDEDDDEGADSEDRGETPPKVLPKQPGEFVCQSCFLVKHPSQLADKERMLCRDCV